MTQNSRLQYSSASKRGKKNKVWIGRWREDVAGPEGSIRAVRRSVILGSVEGLSPKREAERELGERLQVINTGKQGPSGSMTLSRFTDEVWKPSVFLSIKLSTRLVGERGFEPPTPWSRTRCSTRLSHSPNLPSRPFRR
jgi:hypothetical protein